MRHILVPLILLFFCYSVTSHRPQDRASYYAITSNDEIIPIQQHEASDRLKDPMVVATGYYLDDTQESGWIYLSVNTSSNHPDNKQARAAGYFEGFMSYKYIYDTYINEGPYMRSTPMSKSAYEFISNQTEWILHQIEKNLHEPYWQLMDIAVSQQVGIYEGYTEAAILFDNVSMLLPFEHFWLVSYVFDVADVNRLYPGPNYTPEPSVASQHCSFLLKLVEDDLFVSHTTWSTYTSMIRVYKVFNFGYNNPEVKNHQFAFSSQPGSIESGDDFYILENNRFVAETSLECYNSDAINFLHYDSVPYFLRVTVANLAYDTQETWMNYYFSYRSGTYNNQWLIIDFNNYLNNKDSLSQAQDIIWMIEELYYMTSAQDVTQSLLIPQGFVASYNEIYNPILLAYSQNNQNYTNVPRYMLFNKYAPGIQTFEDLQYVMRLNNVSDTGNYCDAIACRCDLQPHGPGPIGAIDCKATSASMIGDLEAYIIAGPTTEMTPIFNWDDWPSYVNYTNGMPRTYNYTWQYIQPDLKLREDA